MERSGPAKCYKCGCTANHFFTFARLSDKETFLGIVNRNVCDECLSRYIDDIKSGRKGRYEFLIWLPILLPFGAILAALAENVSWQIVGWISLGCGLILPALTYFAHRREMKRANGSSFQENAIRYGREMCIEDALRTNGKAKLIEIKPAYAQNDFTAERIAADAGISSQAATTIKAIIVKMNEAAMNG